MTYQTIDFETNCVKVSTFLKRLGKKYPKFTNTWGETIEYGCNTNDGYYLEVVENNYVVGVDASTDGYFYVWFQARCKDQIIDGEGTIYNVIEPVENAEPVEPVENAEPVEPVENAEPEPVENAEPVEPVAEVEKEYLTISAFKLNNIYDLIEHLEHFLTKRELVTTISNKFNISNELAVELYNRHIRDMYLDDIE